MMLDRWRSKQSHVVEDESVGHAARTQHLVTLEQQHARLIAEEER